jgi:magnesium transporter
MAIPHGALPPRIHVIDYDADRVEERDVDGVETLAAHRPTDTVTWIDIQGLGDEAILRRLGEIFRIHPLAIADVANVPQRPKVESYDEHTFIVMRMATLDDTHEADLEQVSIGLGESYVITFQERYGEVLEPVRRRIRAGPMMRTARADSLAYAIIDTLVDGYYPVVEAFGEVLDELWNEVVQAPTRQTLATIHRMRRQLLTLHRAMWQQRDALNSLLREEDARISPGVRPYLRDAYDHAIQIIDVTETFREMTVGLMEFYLSTVSYRMNEVMKVLTVVATVFIPLTFLVGVYGMNFEYMPELKIRWAYPVLWFLMTAIAAGMLVIFRIRGWIGWGPGKRDAGDR